MAIARTSGGHALRVLLASLAVFGLVGVLQAHALHHHDHGHDDHAAAHHGPCPLCHLAGDVAPPPPAATAESTVEILGPSVAVSPSDPAVVGLPAPRAPPALV